MLCIILRMPLTHVSLSVWLYLSLVGAELGLDAPFLDGKSWMPRYPRVLKAAETRFESDSNFSDHSTLRVLDEPGTTWGLYREGTVYYSVIWSECLPSGHRWCPTLLNSSVPCSVLWTADVLQLTSTMVYREAFTECWMSRARQLVKWATSRDGDEPPSSQTFRHKPSKSKTTS